MKTSYDPNRSNTFMRLYSKLIKLIAPLIYLASPALAFAQASVDPCANQPDPWKKLCNISGNNAGKFIGNLVTSAMVLAALVALGFLIYGGLKWIMSEGDKTAIDNARQTIVGAIIGLVIILLSYLILSIVLKVFGIELSNLVIPQATF